MYLQKDDFPGPYLIERFCHEYMVGSFLIAGKMISECEISGYWSNISIPVLDAINLKIINYNL
jgi:hypothetical protein